MEKGLRHLVRSRLEERQELPDAALGCKVEGPEAQQQVAMAMSGWVHHLSSMEPYLSLPVRVKRLQRRSGFAGSSSLTMHLMRDAALGQRLVRSQSELEYQKFVADQLSEYQKSGLSEEVREAPAYRQVQLQAHLGLWGSQQIDIRCEFGVQSYSGLPRRFLGNGS